MEKYCSHEEEIKEKNFKYCEGDINKYGIINLPIEETNIHVFIPIDDFTWREFPNDTISIPKLHFENDVKKEKHFDFLRTNLSADGLLISENAKKILEKFNLGNHKYYPFDLVVVKGNIFKKEIVKKYYWLHFVFDENKDNFINFSKSKFKEKIRFFGDLLEINYLEYNSLNEWQVDKKNKYEKWLNNSDNESYHDIIPLFLELNENKILPDIIEFGRIGNGEILFSKNLIDEIKKSNLTGIEFYNTKLINQ